MVMATVEAAGGEKGAKRRLEAKKKEKRLTPLRLPNTAIVC